jgi:hypothetical protein
MTDIIDKDLELVLGKLRSLSQLTLSRSEYAELDGLINRLAAARAQHPYIPTPPSGVSDASGHIHITSDGSIIWSPGP